MKIPNWIKNAYKSTDVHWSKSQTIIHKMLNELGIYDMGAATYWSGVLTRLGLFAAAQNSNDFTLDQYLIGIVVARL